MISIITGSYVVWGDGMNINLDLYKVFYHVAKNKNITKAANELNITQPGISKAIKNLEEQLGCPLEDIVEFVKLLKKNYISNGLLQELIIQESK